MYVQGVRKPYSRVGSDKKRTYDYVGGGEYTKPKKTRTRRWAEDGFYLNCPGFRLIGIGGLLPSRLDLNATLSSCLALLSK